MPYYEFRELWSPLKFVGIRFYKDDENNLWLKLWNRPRRIIRYFQGS
jgi:hypothetical protein